MLIRILIASSLSKREGTVTPPLPLSEGEGTVTSPLPLSEGEG